ncbi:MAG: hypothetical protein H2174_08685 [Vampirovibrio sp.]|nr:hypothetical protein [Vampirovibrio sp.]
MIHTIIIDEKPPTEVTEKGLLGVLILLLRYFPLMRNDSRGINIRLFT